MKSCGYFRYAKCDKYKSEAIEFPYEVDTFCPLPSNQQNEKFFVFVFSPSRMKDTQCWLYSQVPVMA